MTKNFPINATTSPMKIEFYLAPDVSIETMVNGDARNIASVVIKQGTMPLWTGTLTRATPSIRAPYDIVCGQLTIKQGANFILTIPTPVTNGNVVFNGTILEPFGTQPLTCMIASWPFNS